MSETERESKALRTYEITWHSGHIETIRASQVSWPNNFSMLGGTPSPPLIQFMGEFDGCWTLVLSAHETDIRTIRDVTAPEITAAPASRDAQ